MGLLPKTATGGTTRMYVRQDDRLRDVEVEVDRHPEGGWVSRAAFEGEERAFRQCNAPTCEGAACGAVRTLFPAVSEERLAALADAAQTWAKRWA